MTPLWPLLGPGCCPDNRRWLCPHHVSGVMRVLAPPTWFPVTSAVVEVAPLWEGCISETAAQETKDRHGLEATGHPCPSLDTDAFWDACPPPGTAMALRPLHCLKMPKRRI